MEKIIEIEEGRSLNFKASAFSPIMYNRLFHGRDFLRDMTLLKESKEKEDEAEKNGKENNFSMEDYELFVRIAYTFAYQGLAPTPATTKEQKEFRERYPDAWDWIDTFGTFSIYEILPEIVELWYANERTVSKPKNPVPAPPEK